jgi:hypothetical protein
VPPKQQVPPPPTSDIGHPDLSYSTYGQGLMTDWWETTSDLIWPTSVITYAKMRRDPQLTAVLQAYALPLTKATWALDPEGCRAEVVQHCADDLGVTIIGADAKPGPARRRGVVWRRHLGQAVQHLDYGHMPFERRYRIDGDGGPGNVHLDNLGERPPWTIAYINVGSDGVMQSIEQTTQRPPVPANRLVWYVRGLLGANWTGDSVLRPGYGAWLLKHEGWRVEAISTRRFGTGVPVVHAPPGASQGQLQQAMQLAAGIRVGDQAGTGLPAGFTMELMGMTGGAPDNLGWIRYLDQTMAKMALLGLLELGQTETGSRALGESFLDFFLLSLQGVAEEIAVTATSGHPGMPGIITDLVDQNWGPEEPAPRLVCTDVGESYQVTAEALQGLIGVGVITPDAGLDDWARRTWSLPKRTDPWVPSSRGIPAGTSIRPAVEQQYAQQAVQTENVADEPTTRTPAPRASAVRRREGEAGFNAAGHQQQWQSALDKLLTAYRQVTASQRTHLVDQVVAAAGKPGLLALDPPPLGDGPQLITAAMHSTAHQAAAAMITEAAGQGVTIPVERVRIDTARLAGIAQARAQVAASALAQQASGKALQVMAAAAPAEPPPQQPPPAGPLAGTEVALFLDGLTDANLREQLGAALTAAQNHGRTSVLRAAPQARHAVYVSTEVLDKNTCGPCRNEDGTEFPDIAAAEAAYPMGGFKDCKGFARCRGTVMAVWTPEAQLARCGVPCPYHPLAAGGDRPGIRSPDVRHRRPARSGCPRRCH